MTPHLKALALLAAGAFAAGGGAVQARGFFLPRNLLLTQAPSPAEIEATLLDSVNAERRSRGLKGLRRSDALDDAARAHAADMAAHGMVSHLSSDGRSLALRLREKAATFSEAGENVAHSETSDAAIIHDSLMQSPEHRSTILGTAFDRAGIGVVSDPDSGYYVVEDFTAEIIPRPAGEIRAEMRRRADDWRLKRKLPPLPPIAKYDPFADSLAIEKVVGKPLPDFPGTMGSVRVLIIQTPAVDKISDSSLDVLGARYEGLAVGIAFGSNDEYPGGAYAIILLLFLPERSSNGAPK